ncbi:NAD-dependent epimerase/dehydratase family protein [candidate division NPL-UPA2 bacterium Unc8]|uniref:NAD-dependent epimerase/dehydratase family protein n=1 Tax=candidate division NPL-UPA2 bacterium Unc8 TaxID=1980939 RepID=A0A399FYS9_UNCN2|nr:MAG: NAD-dependent epimerase/dehydratase family protein [candidate division NPL-UPA2 bacterium Unc8]
MNILITGANGFIGKALCEGMLVDGYQVRGAVRSAAQMTALPSGVEGAMVGDISPETDWSGALAGIESIVHLAARAHVMNETSGVPLAVYRQVNVAGTERLAQQAAVAGVKRLVFLSSVKVHGEETNVPYSEENHLAPQDPYGVSKLEAEKILRKVAEETGLEVVILRPPLVYGPGVKANFLRLLSIVERGIPLPFASVNNRRSMVCLGNLVDAIITCISHPLAAGETFLVSDGQDVSTPDLIKMIACAMGKKPRLFSLHPSILKALCKIAGKTEELEKLTGSLLVDSSKIRRELGWQPPYTMAEGLAVTAEWYKKSRR